MSEDRRRNTDGVMSQVKSIWQMFAPIFVAGIAWGAVKTEMRSISKSVDNIVVVLDRHTTDIAGMKPIVDIFKGRLNISEGKPHGG